MAGARNIYGEESEQSKQRRSIARKADELAGEGSVSGKLKKERRHKRSALERVISDGGLNTTRGGNPPQTGQSSHETLDLEGSQDTLKSSR